jgi:hypothetical protein
LALLLTACGGRKHDPFARENCIDAAQARAQVVAVVGAYHAGRLGSATAIRRQIKALPPKQPGFSVTSFLRPDGSIIPWAKMSDAQQRTFVLWMDRTSSVGRALGDDVFIAMMHAKDAAEASCPS